MLGTVSIYSRVRGWGFVIPDDEDQPDHFVLYCWIQTNPSRRFLNPGDRVEFASVQEGERWQAHHVRKLADAPKSGVARA
jgi:cold shock CspA family protein